MAGMNCWKSRWSVSRSVSYRRSFRITTTPRCRILRRFSGNAGKHWRRSTSHQGVQQVARPMPGFAIIPSPSAVVSRGAVRCGFALRSPAPLTAKGSDKERWSEKQSSSTRGRTARRAPVHARRGQRHAFPAAAAIRGRETDPSARAVGRGGCTVRPSRSSLTRPMTALVKPSLAIMLMDMCALSGDRSASFKTVDSLEPRPTSPVCAKLRSLASNELPAS